MSDLVTRLRNWRNVHLARLHILMDEAADYVALLEAGNALSHSGFMAMASAVDGMSGEIKRLRLTDVERAAVERAVKDESEHGLVYTADRLQSMLDRLSASGDFPVPDNAANRDNTPATHDTPSEGREQNRCTLTDAERAAVEWRRKGIIVYSAGTVVATIATAVLSLSLLWFAK